MTCEFPLPSLLNRSNVENTKEDCVLTWVPFSMKLRIADDGTLECLDLVCLEYMTLFGLDLVKMYM